MDIQHRIAKAIRKADNRYFMEDYSKQADAVLAALKVAGFAVVPKEPTERMCEAGINAIEAGRIRPEEHVASIYRGMVVTAAVEFKGK